MLASLDADRGAARRCRGPLGGRAFRLRLRQQMVRQIERVGNDRRDDGARDDGGNQRRVLALIDDPVRKPEQRRDRSEGQSGRHQQCRVHRLLVG